MDHRIKDPDPNPAGTVCFAQTRERAGRFMEAGQAASQGQAIDAKADGCAQRRAARLLLRIPPPLVYVASFLLGLGLQRLLPWMPVAARHEPALQAAGALVLATGILLGPLNALMFLLRGTTLNPSRAPKQLFTGGVYRITRNPMYIGLTLVYVGVALLHAQAWSLLLVVVPLAVVDRVYIPCEERWMAQTFGAEYDAYCQRVRRWLGVKRAGGPCTAR